MKIAITGSKGLVGSHLCDYLTDTLQAEIIPVPRNLLHGNPELLANHIRGCEIIIHLSGASILSYWTKKRKKVLHESRIKTTEQLCKAVSLLDQKPKQFICTSAVGIYNTTDEHDEDSNLFADDFLGSLCKEWENAAFEMKKLNVTTTIFRLGVVLSREGGIIKKVKPVFKLGIGGRLGSGKQMFPYIHIVDLLSAYRHVIKNNSEGIYNIVAPDQVNNASFTSCMKKCTKRPAFFHIPTLVLRILLGEASYVLLNGQRVVPKRLQREGFEYKYLTLKEAVCALT